jgi:hypothetical protein
MVEASGSAELSSRARRFLATLERRPAVPTAEVEAIITGSGFPCFAPWLTFHERYAGYVERSAHDWFIWGLAHRNPYWLGANAVDVDSELDGKTWYITCADGHPSYTYRLEHTGEFLGGPAESFDIHVERLALGWEFKQRGAARVCSVDELRDPAFRQVFEARVKPYWVAEASDRFSRYYMSDSYFVVESVQSGALRRGYQLARPT